MPPPEAQLTAVVAELKATLTPDQIDLLLRLINLMLAADRTAVKE